MSTEIDNGGEDLNDPLNGNDVELRELVYQSLERDGLISRLKAQLRAAVFKTIEKASSSSHDTQAPLYDGGVHGRICRALVLDWLEYAHLLYTQDILQVETSAPHHPAALTRNELLEQLHLTGSAGKSTPLLHALLEHRGKPSNEIQALPEHIKQSIENRFLTEKINDISRVREHFRSLFASTFDASVLDAYLARQIPSTTSSIAKARYEQICLEWIQACSKALTPSTVTKQASSSAPLPALTSRQAASNGQTVTRARRSLSPQSESSSASSSSDNPPLASGLPTTLSSNKTATNGLIPPPLRNFKGSDDEDDERSSSLFSERNATPAALSRLKTIDNIIGGDDSPRTRTAIDKKTKHGTRDIPTEYDDESQSHSQISSVDDVTVDKASPSPSAHIDFLEDF